jgi:DNA-binding CsgD family transcriptional regulator
VASKKKKSGSGARRNAKRGKGATSASSTKLAPALNEEVERFASRHHVTPREREVLLWMAAGRGSAEELASILRRSVNTVQNHIKGLLRGTGTNSKTEVLALFIEHLLHSRSTSAPRKANKPTKRKSR